MKSGEAWFARIGISPSMAMTLSTLGIALLLPLGQGIPADRQAGILHFLQDRAYNARPPTLEELEGVVRQGVDVGEVDEQRNNAIHSAIRHGHLHFVPRLIALGVPTRHRNVFGDSPWNWISQRTGLLSPGTRWGTAQATVGFARELEAGQRWDLLRQEPHFEAFVVARLRPWDIAGRLHALAVIQKTGIVGRIVSYDDGFPGESPGDMWLCVLRSEARRAGAALVRSSVLEGHHFLRTLNPRASLTGGGLPWRDEPPNGFHPKIDETGFTPPSPEIERRLRRKVPTMIRGIAPWLIPDWKTLRVRGRRYWDPERRKMARAYDLQVTITRLDHPDFRPTYRAQLFADGHITRWIRQSGPSPWSG